MNYWTKKEINKEKALEHVSEITLKYPSMIKDSIDTSIVYDEDACMKILIENSKRVPSGNVSFDMVKNGIVEAVTSNKRKSGKRVCVLNFASYKNPGGMFLEGSNAQEECICHGSTLFPVLSHFNDTFYHYNRSNKNKSLYKHRLLYTPDIIFFGDDGKEYFADVITMAAPNRGAALRHNVSEDEIELVMKERIKIILHVAYANNVDVLYLGAYGCGVFKNNPDVVARIISDEMVNYDMKYVFPIPDDKNMSAFNDVLLDTFFDKFIETKKEV